MSEKHKVAALQHVNKICLEVFAGISAIVTHEISNALSIINESAGLLDDLAMIAGEEGHVQSDKVQRMAKSVSGQVIRANKLMKDLNTFAHSGDVTHSTIDLQETVRLMLALTRRKAAARKVEVTCENSGELFLNTRPMVLEALIYLCLINMYEAVQRGSLITAQLLGTDNSIILRFTLDGDGYLSKQIYLTPKTLLLSKVIHADCCENHKTLDIRLSPKQP